MDGERLLVAWRLGRLGTAGEHVHIDRRLQHGVAQGSNSGQHIYNTAFATHYLVPMLNLAPRSGHTPGEGSSMRSAPPAAPAMGEPMVRCSAVVTPGPRSTVEL